MSLDVSLTLPEPITKRGTGVFIRDSGKNKELAPDEVLDRWPEAEVMYRQYETTEVFTGNITHNLVEMAQKADLYSALWRPDEIGCEYAKDITGMLTRGLKRLRKNPSGFKKYNPSNGWGSYEGLLQLVEDYLAACTEYPNAKIEVSR